MKVERVTFQVDVELYERIKEAAWRSKVTMSEYIRQCILIKLNENG